MVTREANDSSCWQPKERPWSTVRWCSGPDSWILWPLGSDPRNPLAGTNSTSGPGHHKPQERTHWSRYVLMTGSHKARPEPPSTKGCQWAPSKDSEVVSAALTYSRTRLTVKYLACFSSGTVQSCFFFAVDRQLICNKSMIHFASNSFAWYRADSRLGFLVMIAVQSAYNLTELLPVDLWRSLIYNRKNKGPNTEPYGTPDGTVCNSEFTPYMTMYWRLLGR